MASSASASTLSSGASSRSISISVHGGAYPLFERRVFSAARLPQGLAGAVEALAREVLRERPNDIYSFAAQHFDYLLQSRTGEWTIAGKKKRSESTRFCYIEGDRSVVNRSNPGKKKCSKSGWSLRETSRILKKPAMFSSEVCQGQIDYAEDLASQESKVARRSSQSPSNVSLFNETDVNAPSIIGDSLGKLTTLEDVGSTTLPSQVGEIGQIMRPRSGSFELVELVDTRHAEGTTRLLRSISFDSILPKRSDSMVSDEIDGRRIIVATKVKNNNTNNNNNNNNNKKGGSVFLPAVKSPWLSSPISATSSSRSSCLPHSCQDQSSEACRVRGEGSDLALPLIKYELPKSAKKCNYALLVLPAVAMNTATGPSLSEKQSFAAFVSPAPAEPFQFSTHTDRSQARGAAKAELDLEEGSLEEGGTSSANTNKGKSMLLLGNGDSTWKGEPLVNRSNAVDECVRMNELGKKLHALQLVERKIERTLVLGGGIFGKATFMKDQLIEEPSVGNESLGKANERATTASEKVAVVRKAAIDLQEEDCKGRCQLSEEWREGDDIVEDNRGGAGQFCDAPFPDSPTNDEHSTGQLEQVVGGGCDSYRNQDIANIVSAAGRIELDEIMEEEIEDEESVGRLDYESRVVGSIVAQNQPKRTATAALASEKTNAPNNNNSRALEDILEKEEKEERDVPGNGRISSRNMEKLTDRAEMNKNPPDFPATNQCDRLADIIASSPDGSLLATAITEHDETAKELIEHDGHCILKKGRPCRLQEAPRPYQQSTDAESENSLAGAGEVAGSPVLRLCHTGEFHDSLPLHLLKEVWYTTNFPSDTGDGQSMSQRRDNMVQIQKQDKEQADTSTAESGNGDAGAREASVLAPSNKRRAFDSEQVSASSEQTLALSTGSFSRDFLSMSKFIQPITFRRIPQDGLASCTVIRAVDVGTNLDVTGFPPYLVYMSPPPSYSHFYPYSSYTMELAIAANAYKLFQDCGGRGGRGGSGDSTRDTAASMAIEEIPNPDTPEDEEKVHGTEIGPIDSLIASSTPSSSAGADMSLSSE